VIAIVRAVVFVRAVVVIDARVVAAALVAVVRTSVATDATRTVTLHAIARRVPSDATDATKADTWPRIAKMKSRVVRATIAVKLATFNATARKRQARHVTSARNRVIWHAIAPISNRANKWKSVSRVVTIVRATTVAKVDTFHAIAPRAVSTEKRTRRATSATKLVTFQETARKTLRHQMLSATSVA
jgi:hypothetical protein